MYKPVGINTGGHFAIMERDGKIMAHNEKAEIELFQRPNFREFLRILKEDDWGKRLEFEKIIRLKATTSSDIFIGKCGDVPAFLKIPWNKLESFATINAISQTGLIKYYGFTQIEGGFAVATNLIKQLTGQKVDALAYRAVEEIKAKAGLIAEIYETFGIHDSDFQVIIDQDFNPKLMDVDFAKANFCENAVEKNYPLSSYNYDENQWRNSALITDISEILNSGW